MCTDSIHTDFELVMLNAVQGAAAACAEICMQRIREVREQTVRECEQKHRGLLAVTQRSSVQFFDLCDHANGSCEAAVPVDNTEFSADSPEAASNTALNTEGCIGPSLGAIKAPPDLQGWKPTDLAVPDTAETDNESQQLPLQPPAACFDAFQPEPSESTEMPPAVALDEASELVPAGPDVADEEGVAVEVSQAEVPEEGDQHAALSVQGKLTAAAVHVGEVAGLDGSDEEGFAVEVSQAEVPEEGDQHAALSVQGKLTAAAVHVGEVAGLDGSDQRVADSVDGEAAVGSSQVEAVVEPEEEAKQHVVPPAAVVRPEEAAAPEERCEPAVPSLSLPPSPSTAEAAGASAPAPAAQAEVALPQEAPLASSPNEGAQMWEVVGGASRGGVIVRLGREISSKSTGRLSCGALVRQLDLLDGRLHYERVTGEGPSSGWVSVSVSDKALLARTVKRAPEPLLPQSATPAEPAVASPVSAASLAPAPAGPAAMSEASRVLGGDGRTCLVFDWDDTLYPQSWISEQPALRLSPGQAATGGVGAHWEQLAGHARVVAQILRTARSLGTVAVVTLSREAWVEDTARAFLKEALDEVLQLQVVYAMQLKTGPVAPADDAYTAKKRLAMVQVMQTIAEHSRENLAELSLVSIGDSFTEKRAAEDLAQESQQSGKLRGMKGGKTLKIKAIKTVKLRDRPSLAQLTSQLQLLEGRLASFVASAGSKHMRAAELVECVR
mmetsp:Transcript_58545/g.181331  ORF Transcript_58545/g.181331 Transcript_58545/m.181331 type:complete len:725 (+) Transcript_58545:84-2258(+)